MQNFKTKNRIIRWLSLALSVAVMGVIFFFSAQEGTESDEVSISLTSLLFSSDMGVLLNCVVRKFAHMLEYMALGAPLYIFLRTFRRGEAFSCLTAAALSALYSVSDEVHQLFVPGRACQVSDMALDSLGAALCIMLLHLILKTGTRTEPLGSAEAGGSFLDICSSALTGRPLGFEDISEENLRGVFQIASAQKLLPTVYFTLKKQGKLDLYQALSDEMKSRALWQISSQIIRTEAFLKVYSEMLSEGANPLCVKGIVCRSLFPEPDQRPSSDEDLLVSQSDWETCVRVLEKNGFSAVLQKEDECTFVSPSTGCRLELHSSLFKSDTALSRRFTEALGDVSLHASSVKCGGRDVLCPSADDHILYIILHAYMHFLNAGVGIRQIMDVAVFARNNTIDYPLLFRRLSAAGAAEFASAVMLVACRYFGLELAGIESCPEFDGEIAVEPLVRDILSGGIYGGGLDRRHAALVTSSENHSFMRALFPRKERLWERFPVLRRHGWLLPAVWVKRLLIFVFEDGSFGAYDEAKRRSELVGRYAEKRNPNK